MIMKKIEHKPEPKKLIIPGMVCPTCEKKLIKTSSVVVMNKNLILHSDWWCLRRHHEEEQNGIPIEKQDRFFHQNDMEFRFTKEYDKSDKSITEGEFNDYKKRYKEVFLPSDPISVSITLRGTIWEAVGRKYAKQLQMIHALHRVYEKKKDTWCSNFKKTFIPSVLTQFRAKGYLSKKQWDLVDSLLRQELDPDEKAYLYHQQEEASEIQNLALPDRLRYEQRKKSFIKWYNDKNGIVEE